VSAITRAEIDALPAFPLIEPDFLTRDEHAALLGFADARIELFGETTPNGDYWQGRTLMPEQIPDPSIRQTLRDLQSRTIDRLTALLAAEFGESPPIYSDLVNYARWPAGYELQPHADSENPGGAPHPFPWRDFASVIYLNDDYVGGEIYFPNLGVELKPDPRTLIVFPGTLFFLHGVRRVEQGMRHTIASFLTFDAMRRYVF
jgi:hypothetical protein